MIDFRRAKAIVLLWPKKHRTLELSMYIKIQLRNLWEKDPKAYRKL